MALYAPCCGLAAHRPQVSRSIRFKAPSAALTPLPAERTCLTDGFPAPLEPARWTESRSVRCSIGRRSMDNAILQDPAMGHRFSLFDAFGTTRDLFLAQRFARHVSPLTTTVYTHPSDEEMRDRLRGLGC